ncbi:intraflagellar transport protein 74 homolog [Halyomorpha halys]|uniref:intraflagellar transport protein 74 homolog n=1 Tax=Halyomorpha halys TaxID=286706 RepID=UPI0006D4E92B|nr:intraflagellar transport protein 74 homolog [Halyomorpha halys]
MESDYTVRKRSGRMKERTSSTGSEESHSGFSSSAFTERQPTAGRLYSSSIGRPINPSSARTNLTTGLKLPEQEAKNSLVIKAMKDKIASQKSGIKLGNVRTATSRGQVNRFVQDKRYYMGTLHLKIGELTDEIDNLNNLCNDALSEYGNSLVYEKKVKDLATEITSMQGNLIDLNLAVDNINTFGDVQKLNIEAKELKENNDSEAERIEVIFSDRLRKEQAVRQMEKKFTKEKTRYEKIISEMGVEMREKYSSLNERLTKSSKVISYWQSEMDVYNKTKNTLTEHIYYSFPMAYEIMKLETKLLDLKRKWKGIAKRSSRPIDEERQNIMDQVVHDNSKILIMETAIHDMLKKIKNLEEIIAFTSEPEEGYDNRHAKYIDLLKEGKAIETYLTGFEVTKQEEIHNLKVLEDQLYNLLNLLSNKLSNMPTAADYLSLQTNKYGAADLLNTFESTRAEHKKVQTFLKKVEIMEVKVSEESKDFDYKCDKIKENLEEYKTCIKFNDNIKNREDELTNLKVQLNEDRQNVKQQLENAKNRHTKLQLQLYENENHIQIISMEKKLSNIAQNVFLMKENIEEMKAGSINIMELRKETLSLLQSLNMFLRNNINM